MSYTNEEVTHILDEWGQGDKEALGRLIPVVFEEVRELAKRALSRESQAHTLQPTALVNEVYMRLVDQHTVNFKNRAHFFGSLVNLMRRILVDHARRNLRAKRGGGVAPIPLDDVVWLTEAKPPEVVMLDDALKLLAELDPRQAEVVELRFFIGLRLEEIAEVLDLSLATVSRDWKTAKIWLRRELSQIDGVG